MGQIKAGCHWVPTQSEVYRLRNSHPDWEMHPDWTAALKHLDAYNLWICEVVFPIAFQWIEEHKAEVYKDIPTELSDDVGIVIEKAFSLAKTLRTEASQKDADRFHQSLKEGTFDPAATNPTWQAMAKQLANAADRVKDEFRRELPQTLKRTTD